MSVIEVLYIEDNPADIELARQALREGTSEVRLHSVPTGEEALTFLRRQGGHSGAPVPDLVILDLNMPGRNGFDILAEIKQDPRLRRIPVLVLSTSASPEDIARSYDLHANSYLIKPMDVDEYFQTFRCIERLFLSAVPLPRKDS